MSNPSVFAIEFDKPDAVFVPGTTLTGRVIVGLVEPLTMRGLRLSFVGRAYVEWYSGSASSWVWDEERFFDHTTTIWGNPPEAPSSGRTPEMPVGRHVFSFAFPIPLARSDGRPLPGSFEVSDGYLGGACGDIRYFVKAHMDRPMFHIDKKVERDFKVPPLVYDLNLDPAAAEPQRISDGKTVCFWCCCCGRIVCVATLPKSGYVPGEVIAISADIINQSRKTIKQVRLRLVQRCQFEIRSGRRRRVTSVVAELTKRRAVPPGQTQRWENDGILVPPAHTTMPAALCRVIGISYFLVFEIVPRGCSLPFDVEMPVIIGTIPLGQVAAPPIPPL